MTDDTATPGWEMRSPLYIGRWTPKILFSLQAKPYRHGGLRRQRGTISQRMLTRTLRNLESAGLFARRAIKSRTVAVGYSLTPLGRTIINPQRGMRRWAQQHPQEVSADVHFQKSEGLS